LATDSMQRPRPSLVLVGGGARSGKSAFALARARRAGERRVYVATAEAGDDEMRARIARHRAERGSDLETIEEPLDLAGALRRSAAADVVVVDCLTLWLANRLLRDEPPDAVLALLGEALAAPRAPCAIFVTNEVGMGIVPEGALARAFRDLAGRAHQHLAAVADEIHVAILGTVLRLRPPPIAESEPGDGR
jgi:adenosylcobinamide kinase / adenosylcobinamide-phosphate guanylyltransferase